MAKIKTTKEDKIVEEYEENEATGVETEEQEADGDGIERPYDPAAIRVDPKTFSLRQIMDMIDEGDLDLAPDFQRKKVWKGREKSRLIESILLRIPLPAFYFSADEDGKLRVVDGLQRLSTVHDFVRGGDDKKGGFSLSNLEYLDQGVRDHRFSELDSNWTRRIHQTQIFVNVIDPQTPGQVKFDIFRRLNTGGTPLNAQEIRHCMSSSKSREFLKGCSGGYRYLVDDAEAPSFEEYAASGGVLPATVYRKVNSAAETFGEATNWAMWNHVRMADKEVILRFCAFRMVGTEIEEYGSNTNMDGFLTEATVTLDTKLGDRKLGALASDLDRAMRNATALFELHAFRKWPLGDVRSNPINRALFESWAVALADYEWKVLEPHKVKIIKAARTAMSKDSHYMNSISSGTGDHTRVKKRFETARNILAEAVG